MRLIHSRSIHCLGLLTAVAVLSGCASTGSSNEAQTGRITITSEPAGAVAYADGTELGATPLKMVPGNHFRSGFVGFPIATSASSRSRNPVARPGRPK